MPQHSAPPPLGEHRARVVEYLRGVALPPRSLAAAIVEERFAADGRRLLRSSLLLWACVACGGDVRDALPVAAAFDLFDRFMRLHDELVETPREDSGSAAVRWGLGQSLNAGDALYALALRSLAQDAIDAERRLQAAALVARAVLRAIEARAGDVASGARAREGSYAFARSLCRRSAALTAAALASGALLAGAAPAVRRAFERAGRLLDAAAAVEDAALAARLNAKAIAAIGARIPDRRHLAAFEEVARYVAARAA